jgi:hypothetical protein
VEVISGINKKPLYKKKSDKISGKTIKIKTGSFNQEKDNKANRNN